MINSDDIRYHPLLSSKFLQKPIKIQEFIVNSVTNWMIIRGLDTYSGPIQ